MRCRFIYCLCSLLFGVLGAVLALIALLLWAEFDSIYGDTVRNQMSIDNQTLSWWFDKWHKPPVKHSLTIHIFELENAGEWRRSPAETKPLMREIGPFLFRVIKKKEEWNFSDTDHHQIWYNERTSYHFDDLLSYQNLDKTALVANAELMVIAPFVNSMSKRIGSVSRISRSLNRTANEILSIYRSNLFVERAIDRIIFGPKTLSVNITELSEDAVIEPEQNDDSIPRVDNSKQEVERNITGSNSKEFAWLLQLIQDNATLRILALYDRASNYFQKLGVEVNPFHLVAAQFDKEVPMSVDNFRPLRMNSILSFYQNNSLERYDLWTGKNQPGRQARLMRWNNQSKLQVWSGKQCNEINGTDGRQYAPFLKRRRIYLFERRICRSILFTFVNSQSTPQGIDQHRYSRSTDFLLSPGKAPPNNCFCRQNALNRRRKSRPASGNSSSGNYNGCNYDGILDLGVCYTGYSRSSGFNESISAPGALPLILTAVHFSGPFTKSIAREVKGVIPDEALYQSVLDIEPVSGIVLHRTVKYQFNLHFTPIQIAGNRSTREVLVPLLWQDEQFTVVSDHMNSIKYLFVYPFKYRELAIMGAGALGAGLLLLATIFMCCCCCSKSKANQKQRLIDEPIGEEKRVKGTGKHSGKVTPIDDNNNRQTPAWGNNYRKNNYSNDQFKHLQTEEDDSFQFEGVENDEYQEEDEEYDPNSMVSPSRQANRADYYNNEIKKTKIPPNGNGNANGYGGNQYPLERLKRDMPVRQSANNMYPPNGRKQMRNGDASPTFDSYGGYYQNRYPQQGYDNQGYDVFGDNPFANPANGQRMPPPPPPPPPGFEMSQQSYDSQMDQQMAARQPADDRDNLLRQIRAGTQLRRTGDSSNNNEDSFDRHMAMTSMFIIQQLLQQQHEHARWQHIQVSQDALAAQMMPKLVPYILISSPYGAQASPAYLPAFHHEQTKAILIAPGNLNLNRPGMATMNPKLPIPLSSIRSDAEYACCSHSVGDLSTRSSSQSLYLPLQERRSKTQNFRQNVPDLNNVIDEYDSPSSGMPNSGSSDALNHFETNPSSNTGPKPSRIAGKTKAEAIRFYGPYRAYNGPKVNENDLISQLSVGDEDDDWDSDLTESENDNDSITNRITPPVNDGESHQFEMRNDDTCRHSLRVNPRVVDVSSVMSHTLRPAHRNRQQIN